MDHLRSSVGRSRVRRRAIVVRAEIGRRQDAVRRVFGRHTLRDRLDLACGVGDVKMSPVQLSTPVRRPSARHMSRAVSPVSCRIPRQVLPLVPTATLLSRTVA